MIRVSYSRRHRAVKAGPSLGRASVGGARSVAFAFVRAFEYGRPDPAAAPAHLFATRA